MKQRQSLRYRLAIAIAGIAGAVVISFGLVVYREMRNATLEAAGTRLRGVTTQLATMLATSAPAVRATVAGAAADSAVVSYLRDPSAKSAAAARSAMARSSTSAGAVSGVELLDLLGRRVLTTAQPWPEMAGPEGQSLTSLVAARDSVAIGWIGAARDTIVYPVVARVTDPAHGHRLLGYLVQRRLSGSRRDVRQLRTIVGSDAQIYVGNSRGDVWTDFVGVAAPPPGDVARMSGVDRRARPIEYDRPGTGAVLAAFSPIANTPWTLLVEFPRAQVLDQLNRGVLEMVVVGIIIVAAGIAVGWRLSGRYTEPLAELAAAAESISAGDYSRRVRPSRSDEFGAVGDAFNRMSDSITTAHEIVQAKAAEAAASEERMHRVIASSGALLYELRVDDGAVRLEWMSDNVTSLLGYTLAQAQAPEWWIDNVHPDERERVGDRTSPVRRRDTAVEYRFRDAQGRYRWVRDDQRVVRDSGHGSASTFRVIGAWLDITEQRQLEEQLRHSQKMEAIGTLAGGVAHDFNNLLTVIASYAAMLLESHEHDEEREDLQEIVAAAARASALTRQLLTFSRKEIVRLQPVNLSDVADRMQGMIRRLVPTNVELVVRSGADIALVLADPTQIEQVLMNLVVNALDAMPEGGTLAIETKNVELDDTYARSHAEVEAGPYVMLSVTDTGVGIDAETTKRIFEPFFTTKEVGHGTGLGLATVHAIVQELNGHVWVYSEPGHGAAFKVYLPHYTAADAKATPPKSNPVVPRSGTVLLVEDDDSVRRATRRMLERLGYAVLEASEGEMALGIAAAHRGTIDVVVTDLMMPRMNGFAFATTLARSRPDLRVVFASGYTDDAVVRRGLLTPTHTFLQKPFTAEQLMSAIDGVLTADHSEPG